MGGISSSTLRPSGNGTAIFSGVVSRENNGGFASVRSPEWDYQIDGYEGIELRLLSDGRAYKVNLQTGGGSGSFQYQAPVSCVEGAWSLARIPFGRFRPVLRGTPQPGAPPLNLRRLSSVGLVIGDGQEGGFRLEISSIRCYTVDRPTVTEPM
jgi:hypothetical protein